MYAGDYDSLFITESKVTGNHAADGAAIYEYWSYLDLVGDSMNSNSTIAGADGYGGAIDSEYGVVDVTKGSISANTAGDAADPGYGGVAYDYYTDYTLEGVTVNGNKATDGGDGGVFYLYFDQLDITGGSVSRNSVTGTSGSGGAIYIDEGAQVGLHGVTMTGDRVAATVGYAEGGGTIYDYAEDYGNAIVIDSGTTITGSDGSAIYLYGYYGGASLEVANSTLSDNTDNNENASYAESSSDLSGCGGAICAYTYYDGASTIGLTGDKVDGNSSSGYFAAGALGAYNGEYSSTSMRLDDDTFDHNVATGKYSSGARHRGVLLLLDDVVRGLRIELRRQLCAGVWIRRSCRCLQLRRGVRPFKRGLVGRSLH